MKHYYLFLLIGIALYSCQEKSAEKVTETQETTAAGKDFEMYTMSEMSLLMEQMYVDNQRLKERIMKGDTIGAFPNHFMEIHRAAMTDDTENDAFFKEQAERFINAQKLIYEDPDNAKTHFNEGVKACIECHQVKCGGPIPRIKKLYIE
ncbi:MAG: hypothetical protein ITG00_05980 [Flavobacterium sp.]|nr:hypothetical protein [Flavobacterium sp.]